MHLKTAAIAHLKSIRIINSCKQNQNINTNLKKANVVDTIIICLLCQLAHFILLKKLKVEKHHIFGGVANRPKSEQYGLFIWLTPEQHKYLHDHPSEMLKLKKIAQATFMHRYNKSVEEFIDIFGKKWI